MAILRILAGKALLDKIPYWIALPLALGAGVKLGAWVAGPDREPGHALVALIVLGLAAALGLTAPRPVRRKRSAKSSDQASSQDELLV